MTHRLFLDTNVVLDFLQHRPPHFEPALQLFILSLEDEVQLYVSDITFTNVAYICRKSFTTEQLYAYFRQLRKYLRVGAADQSVIDQAIAMQWSDFEDAVQYCTALHAGIDNLLTRDPRGFPVGGPIEVVSPTQYLQLTHRSVRS